MAGEFGVASSWGSTTVKVMMNAPYQVSYVRPNIVEIPILCDPATPDVPASVIMGNGRNRKRVSFTGRVTSLADYTSLQSDLTAQTSRVWSGPAGDSMTGVIEDMSNTYFQSNHITFNMVILEDE